MSTRRPETLARRSRTETLATLRARSVSAALHVGFTGADPRAMFGAKRASGSRDVHSTGGRDAHPASTSRACELLVSCRHNRHPRCSRHVDIPGMRSARVMSTPRACALLVPCRHHGHARCSCHVDIPGMRAARAMSTSRASERLARCRHLGHPRRSHDVRITVRKAHTKSVALESEARARSRSRGDQVDTSRPGPAIRSRLAPFGTRGGA